MQALLLRRRAPPWKRDPARRSRNKVPVTVTTVESYFTGSGDAPSNALFSYTAP